MSLKRSRALARLRLLRAEVERNGLPAQPQLHHVAALTAGAIEILDRRDSNRASAAARYLYRIAPQSFRASGVEDRLACRRGCAWCCHGYVSASAPQIFAAAGEIRRDAAAFDAVCARIRATSARVRGLEWRARIALREPCPLLADGACGIYEARPLSCRGFASFSAEACKRAYDALTDDVMIPQPYANVRSALESALRAALKACTLPAVSYELTGALSKALADSAAEARWLEGETVFDPDSIDRSADAATEFQREVILDTVIAAARGEAPR
ncbi:MAG: YkgJ family cysteine cluster protein [Burkholderiales bacterium]